jgi:hypothetical protein
MNQEQIEALKFFTKNELAMTDEEWAQTKISYDPTTQALTFNFGDGFRSTPERTTALRRWVMGIPAA